jgi:alkaline phosphatase
MRNITITLAMLMMAGCATTRSVEPRNVILFIGDGMGISTITAARIHAGQLAGGSGEEHNLSFDTFPNVALVKTYNTDLQVPDSAGTMSAMMTGEKTKAGVISVGSAVERSNCATGLENSLPTLLEQAEQAGYRTGVVSTATITHATPAATYAHAANRGWEHDANMPAEALEQGCIDIARQLVEFSIGDGIEVMLGGGRNYFHPAGYQDPEDMEEAGVRVDGRNLVDEWLAAGTDRSYVWNTQQFNMLDPVSGGPVLGLFEPRAMQYETDRKAGGENEPSLAEMTAFAINRLQGDPQGFFLMVEGGRIDHGHHMGNAYRALTDTLALDAAVSRALELTDPANTLILVTADHSHTLTISGYPRRGNPILNKVEHLAGEYSLDEAGMPYTTLGYMNGPGYREELPDLTDVDTEARDYLQVAAYPTGGETHGGEDVAAFTNGLGAHRLGGVIEQNLIYDVMFEALFGVPPERETGQ